MLLFLIWLGHRYPRLGQRLVSSQGLICKVTYFSALGQISYLQQQLKGQDFVVCLPVHPEGGLLLCFSLNCDLLQHQIFHSVSIEGRLLHRAVGICGGGIHTLLGL